MKESVGSHFASIPFVIMAEKRRSAPTATIIEPEAQAKVSTINAGTTNVTVRFVKYQSGC